MTQLTKQLNYLPLIQALLLKTEEGKLLWQATADDHRFVSSAGDERVFEIRRHDGGYELVARDRAGGVLVSLERYLQEAVHPSERNEFFAIARLYDHAKRVARRIDENMGSTLQLLEQL